MDTGGYRLEGEELDRLVSGRSMTRADTADIILLMLDVEETTPEDEAFIENLRLYADRIIVVVNKVDNEKRLQSVWIPTGSVSRRSSGSRRLTGWG